jgi:hypothetical protein
VHDLLDEGISIGSKDQMYRHQMFFKELPPRTSSTPPPSPNERPPYRFSCRTWY